MNSAIPAIVLILSWFGVPALAKSYISVFSENEKFSVSTGECESGVISFPSPKKLSCVCLNGIYSFLHYHKNCSDDFTWTTRGGHDHCYQITNLKRVNRIELISSDPTSDSLTILDGKYHFVKGRYNESTETPEVRKGDDLVVIGSWTLLTPEQNALCVDAEPGHYCTYNHIPKFGTFRPGCHGSGKRQLTPSKCRHISTPNDIKTACPSEHRHVITKREIKGRSFLPATMAMAPAAHVPDAIEREEDFGLRAAKGSELIKSEVWTYLTQQTSLILREKNLTSDREYVTPAFDILQLSKRIMAKSCPSFYVKPSHWDMSVSSFISMQQRSFKFRESMIDLIEYKRIKDTLERCLVNLTEIPFIPPNETCVDGEIVITLEEGMYFAHGEVQTMNMIIDQMSTQNEPFIETVWKIFVHVHSLCYEYFKASPSRINDHHRFTELLMPLFTNDVWDIWMKDGDGKNYELKKDVYDGLLGDATKLMSRVDYCAWFPRFEANYPWDLIRPKAKQQTHQRKKRSTSEDNHGICAAKVGDFNCKIE